MSERKSTLLARMLDDEGAICYPIDKTLKGLPKDDIEKILGEDQYKELKKGKIDFNKAIYDVNGEQVDIAYLMEAFGHDSVDPFREILIGGKWVLYSDYLKNNKK